MLDYLKGIVFVILFLWFLGTLGKRIHKANLFSENLIYGFIIYTCVQFVGGFIAQQLRLPWVYYQVYMIVSLIILIGVCFYKQKLVLHKEAIVAHFKHYGILYVIAIIFVVLACLNIQYQWNSNNVDDGYYLMKMRIAPYVENYTDYTYATGFASAGSIIRNVNTFELEGAFYTQLMGMDASVYAKVFLSFINYVLLLNSIYWFFKTIAEDKSKWKNVIIAIIPILFFGIYQELMVNYGILNMQDSWQFNTAMWYGSTLVRTAGIFILIVPLLRCKKFTIRTSMFYVLTSIALMSKASQALPIIVLVALIYGLQQLAKYLRNKKIFFAMLVVLLLVLICLPIVEMAENNLIVINLQLSKNFSLFIVKLCLFFVVTSYLFEVPMLKKWNNWLLCLAFFMFVPRVNTLFAYLCIYDFVAARTVTLFLFTLIVTAMLDIYFIVLKLYKSERIIYILYTCIAIALISVPIISVQRNLGLGNTLSVLLNNPKLQPETTLTLGSRLGELKNEKGVDLNVLMPMWLVNDGTPHPASTLIRYTAFDVNSIGALGRYNSQTEDSEFVTYDQEEQIILEKYHSGEDRDDKKLQKLLDDYPINCIVVYYDDVAEHIQEKFEFELVDKIMLSDNSHYYYILYKK